MQAKWRLIAVAAAVVCLCAAIAIGLGTASSSRSTVAKLAAAKNVPAFLRAREGQRGEQGGESEVAQANALRAYPSNTITFSEQQNASKAAKRVKGKGHGPSSQWEELGPTTLNVDRLGTQSFGVPTQWSGRQTALAVAPNCRAKSRSCWNA